MINHIVTLVIAGAICVIVLLYGSLARSKRRAKRLSESSDAENMADCYVTEGPKLIPIYDQVCCHSLYIYL